MGTNSRATMPWGRLKARRPAILPQRRGPARSSFNVEQKPTGSRRSDGRVGALSGSGAVFLGGDAWPAIRRRSRLRKIQLHADAIGVIEEDLGVAGPRHDLLAKRNAAGLQALANTVDIGGGEGDVVEAAGVLEFLLGAAHHDALARLAGAHQMDGRLAARIKPVAGEIERRALAILEPEHVAIELLGLFEILRLDGEML